MTGLIIGAISTAPSTTASNYTYPFVSNASSWSGTEANRLGIVSHAMTVSNLRVLLDTAPGGSASWTFTLRKNSAATALSCVISGSATSAVDTSDTVTFAAGDTIDIQATPSTTPTAPTNISWSMQQSATGLFGVLGGASGALTTTTEYNNLQSASSWNATETKLYSPMPTSGTYQNLNIRLTAAPGAGNSYTFTLMKNSVATALTVTISGSSTTGSDTTDTVSVVAGDLVSLQQTSSGTPTSASAAWAMSFAPTIDGQSFFLFGDVGQPSQTAVGYDQPLGRASNAWSATQPTQIMRLQKGVMSAYYLLITAGPGVGKSYTIAVQQNAVTTALSLNLTGTTTTGNIAAGVAVNNDDTFNLISTPSGTPAVISIHTGILYTYGADSNLELGLLGAGI